MDAVLGIQGLHLTVHQHDIDAVIRDDGRRQDAASGVPLGQTTASRASFTAMTWPDSAATMMIVPGLNG